jgi:hypothetical protein
MPYIEIVVAETTAAGDLPADRTISARRPLSEDERQFADDSPDDVTRPSTRAECLDGGWNEVRPCPFVLCRFHLAVDITRAGSLVFNRPGQDLESLPETCALDVADDGPHTLEEVAAILDLSRERVRQIEEVALAKLRRGLDQLERQDEDSDEIQ